jgi:hypothetical protein
MSGVFLVHILDSGQWKIIFAENFIKMIKASVSHALITELPWKANENIHSDSQVQDRHSIDTFPTKPSLISPISVCFLRVESIGACIK